MEQSPGNGRSPHQPEDLARFKDVTDRLMQAIAEQDTVDSLAQRFCIIMAETFDGMAAIQMLNQHNELMHLAGLHDVDPHAQALFQAAVLAMTDQPRDQGAAGRIILTGEPLLIPSLPEEALRQFNVPEFLRYVDEIGISTTMGIPLKGRSGNIGVLTLSRRRGAQGFMPEDLSELSDLGVTMSSALDRLAQSESLRAQLLAVQVEKESRVERATEGAGQAGQAARLQSTLDRIMKVTLEHGGDADRLAQEFCVIIGEAIGDLCTILLANPHNDMLHLAGRYEVDPGARALLGALSTRSGFLPRQGNIVALVARTGQPMLRKSMSEEELKAFGAPEFAPYIDQVGVESVMAVPLLGRSGKVGVIAAYRHRGGKPYDEDDLALLTELGLRISIDLENVLLIESLREQLQGQGNASASAGGPAYLDFTDADRLAMLHRLTHMIGENRERIDRMMELASVMTSEWLGGTCNIALLNRHNELVHVAAYYDADPRARALMGEVLRTTQDIPRDSGMMGRVIKSGEPQLVPVVDEEAMRAAGIPAVNQFLDEIGVSSMLTVPVRGDSDTVGAISVSRHRGDRPFNEADRHFLTEIAYRLAIGVENHQLIESLRREVAARSSTQVALNASEQRFRSVFDSTALGIEIMDAAGVIIDINKAFERMSGFSRADMLGQPYGTLQHPEDALPFMQMLTEVKMNRQVPAPVENRILRKDGSVLWARTHLAPVKHPDDGAISFIVALHEDITGRKQTERYFQAVLEATPDALVMVDADGKILLINRQMESLFGYVRHEILGQAIEMLIPERLRGNHPLHRAGYLLEPHLRPMGVGLELFGLRKDGTEFPVEISLSPLEAEGGQVVVAAIRDISERKQREAALVRSERMLTEAQKIARLGSLDYDIASETLELSSEAMRLFGIAPGEPISSAMLRAHMHPEDEPRVVENSYAAVENHSVAEIEFRVVHPDGTVRILHDRVQGIYDADGKPVRMIGTVQDVTEQRQAEKELAELRNHLQTSVELERLRLAQELHDGPMQDLYGSSYRLDELIGAVNPDVQASLQEINDEIQLTISGLRAIAKELRPPAISNFGLEKAIRSYVEDFREKHPSIKLHLSLAQDRQMLPENMRLTLFRVFQQALANVVRHSRASDVRVRFSLDAEEARLEVIDNGMGFAVPANWMGFVRHGHYGLAGAAERVHALGGILLVDSAPQRSTTVTAVIPWTPGGEPSTDGKEAAGTPIQG